jgi:hypothetical protein
VAAICLVNGSQQLAEAGSFLNGPGSAEGRPQGGQLTLRDKSHGVDRLVLFVSGHKSSTAFEQVG